MSSSAAAAPGLVLARDVSKTFGSRKALDGVSISVASGEMVAGAAVIASTTGIDWHRR